MMRVPRAPNGFGDLLRWAQEVTDYLQETEPQSTINTLLSRSTGGTVLSSIAEFTSETTDDSSGLRWRGEWSSEAEYLEDDIVIYYTDDQAGTYVANTDIAAHGIPPAQWTIAAEAHAVIVGDAVDSIVVDVGGQGYSDSIIITITGDGEGATAHAVTSGGIITSIVVDSGGSGYTAAAIDIGSPGRPWDEFARGHWQRIRFAQEGGLIVADAKPTGSTAILAVYADEGDTETDSIELDTALTNGKKIYPQELVVCESDGPKGRMFLCSDSYEL